MSRFLVAMLLGQQSPQRYQHRRPHGTAWPVSQRSTRHRLRHHTGKSPINLAAPVHTPRRRSFWHNRMVPAVLR